MKKKDTRYKIQDTNSISTFFLVLSLFLVSCFLFFVTSVQAVSISPLKYTLVVEPGGKQAVALTVENTEARPATFALEADSFTVDAANGRPIFGALDEAQKWIHADASNFTLAPNEKRNITFDVVVPAGAEPTTHHLAIFAREISDQGGMVSVGARAGALMILTVAGTVHEGLSVDFLTPSARVSVQHPPSLLLQLRNTGTVQTRPSGEVTLTSWSGQQIARIPLNESGRTVFSGMRLSETIALPALTWRESGPIFAHLRGGYGVSQQIFFADTIFWFLPWSALAGIGIVILISFSFFIFLRKRSRRYVSR